MKLTDAAVAELAETCRMQKTDLFLRTDEMPRRADLEKYAAVVGRRVLVPLPGAAIPVENAPCTVLNTPEDLKQPLAGNAVFADIRLLSDEGFAAYLHENAVDEAVIPFYELADRAEYGSREAYGNIASLRASLPYFLQVTGLSPCDRLSDAVFEALGTEDFLQAGTKPAQRIYGFRAASERAKLYAAAAECEKTPLKRTVVQCATRRQAEELQAFLYRRGAPCGLFHGGRGRAENGAALAAFTGGKCNLLAATKALLPAYPFFSADKVLFCGLPYSVSHALRCLSLANSKEILCVYCDKDVSLPERLSRGYYETLQLEDEAFLARRADMLRDLMDTMRE